MGAIYIDNKNFEIKVDGNTIVFYEGKSFQGRVPIQPLDRVVIVGNHRIETSVLWKLALNGISVIFLSGRNLKFGGILHGRIHNNGLLRLKQYEKSKSDFCLEVSKELIMSKIKKQAELLGDLALSLKSDRYEQKNSKESLEAILSQVREQNSIDSLRGLEGSAAKIYLEAFTLAFPAGLGFKTRTRRPPQDPVNAILSLVYTLVHFELVREIEVRGLDPTIGFYHSFEYGRESLACDLIEEFRPDVDRFVLELFRNRDLRNEDFKYCNATGQVTSCYLSKTKRKDFFNYYENWAKPNRENWREKVNYLSRRIMND